jgi:hypothetical protein
MQSYDAFAASEAVTRSCATSDGDGPKQCIQLMSVGHPLRGG